MGGQRAVKDPVGCAGGGRPQGARAAPPWCAHVGCPYGTGTDLRFLAGTLSGLGREMTCVACTSPGDAGDTQPGEPYCSWIPRGAAGHYEPPRTVGVDGNGCGGERISTYGRGSSARTWLPGRRWILLHATLPRDKDPHQTRQYPNHRKYSRRPSIGNPRDQVLWRKWHVSPSSIT